jgi:CheY-like chemotaxis protein
MGGETGASGPKGLGDNDRPLPGTARAGEAEALPGQLGNQPVKPLRILLAEDVPINQKFLSGFLRRAGYEVVIAVNGREALEELERSSFDAVLMDVQMPELDGLEATRRIRENAAGKFDPCIPIIALTAFALKDDRERFLSAGMDAYVSKPVDMKELIRIIAEVTTRRRLAGGGLPPSNPAPEPSEESSGAPRLRDEDALRRCLNDRQFLWGLRRDFAEGLAQAHLEKLKQAAAGGDVAGVRGQAHAVKGALALIGAERGRDLALRLENWPGDGDREELASLVAGFEEEMLALIALIRQAGA